MTITDIWLDRAREQIACRTSEGDIIVLDVGKAGLDTGTGAELHLLPDSVDLPDEAWHHPIGPDWPPTQPERRGPRAAIQTPLSGHPPAWDGHPGEELPNAGPARERPIQAPSPYPRPVSQRGWSVPTDAERRARLGGHPRVVSDHHPPGWPVPAEAARGYEPPLPTVEQVARTLGGEAVAARGLCDGCGDTDKPVGATDDGRAQVCPDCRSVIEQLDAQAAEQATQPPGPVDANPTQKEIRP